MRARVTDKGMIPLNWEEFEYQTASVCKAMSNKVPNKNWTNIINISMYCCPPIAERKS